EILGVLAVWDGEASTEYGLCYRDPRLAALGLRCMLPPHLAGDAAADLGAELVDSSAYEAHRIALGVPRGGLDFIYGDAFRHESEMDQFGGVDFDKGCFVGQEVVSRIEHRGTARTRVVPMAFDGFAPEAGTPVSVGDKTVGTFGSSAQGRALAMLRLDRAADALAAGQPFIAGGVEVWLVKPALAQFAWPGEAQAPGCTRPSSTPTASNAVPGPSRTRSTSPITTRNGGCRNTMTARSTRSSSSTASRPACLGSPSCASARISAAPSMASSRRRSRATRRRRS